MSAQQGSSSSSSGPRGSAASISSSQSRSFQTANQNSNSSHNILSHPFSTSIRPPVGRLNPGNAASGNMSSTPVSLGAGIGSGLGLRSGTGSGSGRGVSSATGSGSGGIHGSNRSTGSLRSGGGDISSIGSNSSSVGGNGRSTLSNNTSGALTTTQAIEIIFLNNVNAVTVQMNIDKSIALLDNDYGHIILAKRGTTDREPREVNEKFKAVILAIFGKLGKKKYCVLVLNFSIFN